MSTLYIVLILGTINARRSFNEEKLVKQQAILATKKVRLHEEIRKLDTKNIAASAGKSDVGAKI